MSELPPVGKWILLPRNLFYHAVKVAELSEHHIVFHLMTNDLDEVRVFKDPLTGRNEWAEWIETWRD